MRQRLIFYAGVVGLASTFPLSSAFSQQADNFAGSYISGFGSYVSGTSAQQDNGFALPQPTAATAAVAAVAPAPPPAASCPPGEIELVPGDPTTCVPAGAPGDGGYRVKGGFGGIDLGYNKQYGRFVLGIEGDIAGGRAAGFSLACGNPLHTCGSAVTAVADVRGRLGYTFDRLLPYVTGGLAVDRISAYDSLFAAHGSGWRAGYTVGVGVEYKLTPRLSLRAEYLHTAIGSSYLYSLAPGVPERVSLTSDAARVYLSYWLTAPAPQPVIARY